MDDTYVRSLDDWKAKAKDQLAGLARVACQDLAEAVVDDTPVDLGFLVGNWQPSLNAPSLDIAKEPQGSAYAMSNIGLVVSGIELGDIFYYSNNTVYARRIEYGFVGPDSLGRVYNQQGRYMVTMNVMKWPDIVAGAARKLGIEA